MRLMNDEQLAELLARSRHDRAILVAHVRDQLEHVYVQLLRWQATHPTPSPEPGDRSAFPNALTPGEHPMLSSHAET